MSRRPAPPLTEFGLHCSSPDRAFWTTTNVGEAVPGVMTPLNWSLWGPAVELGIRGAFCALGALPHARAGVPPRPEDRIFAAFYGRIAIRLDFFCEMGDAIPGTTGAATTAQILGFVPEELKNSTGRATRPQVLAKFPITFATVPSMVRRTRASTDPWWRQVVAGVHPCGRDAALRQLLGARNRFVNNVIEQSIGPICGIQPIFDQVSRLAESAGVDGSALLGGAGHHEETQVVQDLWEVSRERLSLADFVARHGYHGPLEGEVSSLSWRDDPQPALKLATHYQAMSEEEAPSRTIAERERQQARVRRELLKKLPLRRQPAARALLRLADIYLPLRGVGKVSFLQSLDAVRFCARRLGEQLVGDGIIDAPDDVFFLTLSELVSENLSGLGSFVASRRQAHADYKLLDLPGWWQGDPRPTATVAVSDATEITGVAAAPGVVEGRVRVVDDPTTDEIEAGEILVARTTDPSWAALMFMSKALVVDIGGIFSHAAVVARELSIPCVMGAGHATTWLRTGDVCRVDGSAGTVELLERAATTAAADSPVGGTK